MIIGYARVSTDGQTLDAQQSALAAAGAERVFAEKISGAVTDRKALGRAVAALGAGDVLLVTRAGSAGPKHQGPSKRPRCGQQSWWVQVASGCLGRYHNTAREVDANRARRSRRVRAGVDPVADRRRPQACASTGRPVRPQACADPISTSRSAIAKGSGRAFG